MAKSIIQKEKECFICRECYGVQNIRWLEEHHIFGNHANRKLSEAYGLKVHLCWEHHQGNGGVHRDKQVNRFLHKIGQIAFEENYGNRSLFMQIFGKNYL